MKKLGTNGLKVIKILHLLFAVMWIGGVMALVSLLLGTQPATPEMMFMSAKDHLVIDKLFLIPGGFGIVLTSLAYSILTKWGFAKHRWILVKWTLTILLVILGKAYMGVVLEQNFDYATQILNEQAVTAPFFQNIHNVAVAGIVQLVGFGVILILSVTKPWKKASVNLSQQTLALLIGGIVLHAIGKILHLRGEDVLFYPGVVCFVLGHICYLWIIIRRLGKLRLSSMLILFLPLLVCWLPAALLQMPMALVASVVMFAILMYISSGIVGLMQKDKTYSLILLGGLCFLVSDAITGTQSADSLSLRSYIISQVTFYAAEAAIICGIIKVSKLNRFHQTGK